MKPFVYVANWKMNLSFTQEVAFAKQNQADLIELGKKPDTTIVLCPSYCSLAPLSELFKNSSIALGAQDCSAYKPGAHTGQIHAQTLAELGCTFCIVGHSEKRTQCHETNEQIAQKVAHLIVHNITPIICIGETIKDHRAGKTVAILEEQLAPIVAAFIHAETIPPLCFAYEPIWAIGTGVIPTPEVLKTTYAWLRAHLQQKLGHASQNTRLMYGGSVDEQTSAKITMLADIDGLLIGSASLDFQKFKKIVELQR
ncbi:triose-phosphate isomerase [Methylicorpusculum sp.]|uniref:triose-phosphate isomerase n=1 Tax=Methylicorpusculum sp. TaxID=2713644 RepID=UPI002AB8D8DD|nr:triose-phosphate isomerase [Methylicorpusculum sp.]MDZ4154147.1 triose-phosphate isomerase [Methylicorpusculum sp.]